MHGRKNLTTDAYPKWEISCKVAMTVQVVAIVGDFMSIFLITMDRFICINFPLRYKIYVTKNRVYMVLFMTFISAKPFSCIQVWVPKRYAFYVFF